KLQDDARAIETERSVWAARRGEIESECRRQTQALEETSLRLRRQEQDLAAVRDSLDVREQTWREGREALERLRTQLAPVGARTSRQAEEVLGWRKELDQLKHQLHERFRH